eukprot:sb/3465905/
MRWARFNFINPSCQSAGVCPYYTARKQALSSDLVLLPYNYLTDMNLRSRYQGIIKFPAPTVLQYTLYYCTPKHYIPFQNSIVIFDEAHNIASFCEAGFSFLLPLTALDTYKQQSDQDGEELCEFLSEVADGCEEMLFRSIGDVNLPSEAPEGQLGEFLKNVLWVVEHNVQDRYHVMHKKLLVEPRAKDQLPETIEQFRATDTALFAVCRGKLSEGIDLPDVSSVIVIGIPFSYIGDDLVKLKMEFLTKCGLSGQEWYKQCAFRAVNQAIGRAIRHKNDRGMMVLMDQRFKRHVSLLPTWVRESLSEPQTFGQAIRETVQFYKGEKGGKEGTGVRDWVMGVLWMVGVILYNVFKGLRMCYRYALGK